MLARALDKARRAAVRMRGLRALEGDPDPTSRVVARAIGAARAHDLAPAERAWVDRIEELRARLQASTRPITRVDFGAGAPDAGRDERAMSDGVTVVETLGDIARNASKSPFWCRFLFALVRGARPSSGVEMGTAVGISASYQAAALALNGGARFATLEGAASLAALARASLNELGLGDVEVVEGRFADTLPSVLAARRPLDYVFVDGHHDGEATGAYFELLGPHLAPRAWLVFDDIAWSDGMRRAWQRIAHDERVALAVDLGAVGVVVLDATRPPARRYRIPLH